MRVVDCQNESGLEALAAGTPVPTGCLVSSHCLSFSFQNPQSLEADLHPKRNCELDESGHSFLQTHPACLGSDSDNTHSKHTGTIQLPPGAETHPALPVRAHLACSSLSSPLTLPQNRLCWPLGRIPSSQESGDHWFLPYIHLGGLEVAVDNKKQRDNTLLRPGRKQQ